MKTFIVAILLISGISLHRPGLPNYTQEKARVMGIFFGRTPCQEIGSMLKLGVKSDCDKLKWHITFFQDPRTGAPTTYEIRRTLSRDKVLTGKWSITKGTPDDPSAIVYQLVPTDPAEPIYLMKADENVLFFLDNDKRLLVGNQDFSYTLDRKQ